MSELRRGVGEGAVIYFSVVDRQFYEKMTLNGGYLSYKSGHSIGRDNTSTFFKPFGGDVVYLYVNVG